MLDKFFVKYEEGGGGINLTPPQEKLPSKSPALLGLNELIVLVLYIVIIAVPNRVFKSDYNFL